MIDCETIRLSGVVRGAGMVCGDLKPRIEEGLPVERSVRLDFELETDAGQRVKVLAGEARLIGEKQERRCTYGELGDDPRLACFETRPGPHVRTELGGLALFAGDRVAILAEVTRRGYLEGGAAYRSAPAEQILEVKAKRIACGPDAERQLVEPPAEPAPAVKEDAAALSARIGRNVLPLILALAGVLALVLPLAGRARGATAGLLLVMAVLILRRRGAPRFHPLQSHPARDSWDEEAARFPSAVGMVTIFILAGLVWPVVTFLPLSPTAGRLLGVAMVGLPALVGFFYLHVRSAPSLRRLRAMLAAAPLRPGQSGDAFGALVGTLVSPLKGAKQKLALCSFFTFASGEQVTTGSGTETRVNHRIAERTEVGPGLALCTDGKELKVPLDVDVRWASTEQGRSMRRWKGKRASSGSRMPRTITSSRPAAGRSSSVGCGGASS